MTFREEFICFRALNKITVRTVWHKAGVAPATIVKFEKGKRVFKSTEERLRKFMDDYNAEKTYQEN